MSNKPAKITPEQHTIDGTHPDQVAAGFLRVSKTQLNSVRNEHVLNDIARKLASKNVHIVHISQ